MPAWVESLKWRPRLKILITNDDGVYGDGLWRLAEELSKVAEIVIVAPDREQSGVGTAVTLHRPLRVRDLTPWRPVPCYAVEGTPADCVILGLRSLCQEKVDMIFSGINDGANLGNDVLISGTVGAAMQGYFYGVPSVAMSVAALHDVQYSPAANLALALAERFRDGQFPDGLLLNVNLPNVLQEEVKGIEVTRLAARSYMDVVKEDKDARGKTFHWITRGTVEWTVEEGTDIWAVRDGRISITPLQSNLAANDKIIQLKSLCSYLLDGLKTPGFCDPS